jgi:TRAP-type C4-dicarboxylate transport system permease small subunit
MSIENKHSEFAALAPYALIASVLFSLLSGVLLVAGLYDASRSEAELPARTIYTLVMYGAFAFSMAIAAFSSFHAFLKLRKLKTNASENTVAAAIHSLTAFLKAVYFWLILVLLAAGISVFVPMN